jgi:hypothetical protein
MDFLSLYLYNILINKVFNSEFIIFLHSQRVTCYEGYHFFVGNSWNGGIHSGTVENNLYSGIFANVNSKGGTKKEARISHPCLLNASSF